MIKRLCFCIFILIGFIDFTVGQDREREYKVFISDSILNARGEVYFTFSHHKLTSQLEKIISIDNIKESTVYAYANKVGFYKFLDLNIEFQLQPENFLSSRLKSGSLANPDLIYPAYNRYLEIMQDYQKRYSSYCELHEAGVSVQGRKLLMIKISSPSNVSDTRPAVFLTSSIHGNELAGYKLLLWFTDYLFKNYGEDMLVTKLMDETEIWINPLANPDGTYFGGDHTVVHAKRFNANDLDLNRNYPDPAEGIHPDESDWQPETIAMMNFYKEKKIALSAALHTGEELVNYPWDTWAKLHADNNWYKQISRDYVDLAHRKSSAYMTTFNNGIVNGYYWYRITGGQQDFVNYYLNSREITIELSKDDMPDSLTLSKYWEYNRESLLKYIEKSLFGIRGKITDSATGLPLKAKVELLNHDKDNSWVYSDSLNGKYYRLLSPGTYSIVASEPGYSNVYREFTLQPNEMQEFDFELEPGDEPVIVYPNPFKQNLTLLFSKDQLLAQVKITLNDINGRVLFVTTQSISGKILHIPLPRLPDGVYILKIESREFVKQFEVLKMD